jgi:hypothetical protein
MKKMKLALIAVALFAIGSAFAPISKAGCEDEQQYIPNGSGGYTAVTIGVDGNCLAPSSPVCTYYNAGTTQNPNYQPCITDATFQ